MWFGPKGDRRRSIGARADMKKTRVCQICSGDLWGGKEAVSAALARGIAVSSRIEGSAVVFREGRLLEEFRAAGLRVDLVDERTHGPRAIARALQRILGETNPHVLHAHGYKEHVLGALAARGTRTRVVRTLHGLPEPPPPARKIRARALRAIERFVIRLGTHVLVAVSGEIEDRLRGRTGRARLVRIRNGIERDRLPRSCDREGLLRELGLPGGTVLFGAVGRLVPVKGLDVLLDAAARFAPDRPEHRYLLVGDGPLREELERRAEELGIADRVLFLGHRDDADRVIGCLDALVMPSRHEGMPMALLEARALGVPIVASRTGGIAEAVSAEDGLLVEPGDAAALAEALRGIRFFPRRPRERFSSSETDEFSASRMIEEYVRVYEEEAAAIVRTNRSEPS